jgi:cytochrome c oxidase subunit 2
MVVCASQGIVSVWATATSVPLSPTNLFAPASTPAESIHQLALFILLVSAAIFLVVFTLLTYAVVRFRRRPGDPPGEPPQVYGSRQIELAWTIIPVLIVVVLFLSTSRVIFELQHPPRPPGAVMVTAIGHQFWWEYRYPGLKVVTANELHVPISDPANPTPTFLELWSADTDHSFWVPRLAGKTDLIPNRRNEMWIEPREPGLYVGQCAQYCGTQHAKMLLRVYAHTPQDFERWVKEQASPAREEPSVARGRRIFEQTSCVNCHTVAGTSASGRFGPDLTHLMSRETLASGAVPNNRESLRRWLENPSAIKPGALMPPMGLAADELDAMTDYLLTLH